MLGGRGKVSDTLASVVVDVINGDVGISRRAVVRRGFAFAFTPLEVRVAVRTGNLDERIWIGRRRIGMRVSLVSQDVQKALQQGRSEAHGATNKEGQVCARRRDGEPAVSCGEA